MPQPLLATKLYVPPVRSGLLPRPRLIGQLDRGLDQKLTLISAPAGFGKTTLLSEWVHGSHSSRRHLRAAWLSLDSGDNDPARFLTYLVAALKTVTPDEAIAASLGQDLLGMLRAPGFRRTSLPLEELLTALINDIDALSEHLLSGSEIPLEPEEDNRRRAQSLPADSAAPAGRGLALILDDYHVIEADPIHDALTFLLNHLPPRMHIAIATRTDPPLPMARLRGHGQINEIRQSDLSFTPEEAEQFLTATLEMGLSSREVAALSSRTEGWIAGLQMASLAIQSRLPHPHPARTHPRFSSATDPPSGNVVGFIEAFTGSERFVMDYLIEEVLERQPSAIQAFLLQTSILDGLTGPLCDAVVTSRQMGRTIGKAIDAQSTLADLPFCDYSGQEILEYLERANLFLIPLDDSREWYRYHHLFSDLLRQRLSRVRPDLVSTLHRRASEWYERNDQKTAAISHALSAGDNTRAADLIEQVADAAWMRSEVATFLSWVEALPGDLVRSRPMLGVYYAMALLMGGYPLGLIESRLQDMAGADPNAAAPALKEDEPASPVHAGMTVVQALVAAYQGRSGESAELSQRALELLPPESLFLRSLVIGILGLAHLYGDDFQVATRVLQEAVRVSQQAGNVMNAVLAQCHLAELAMMKGQFRRAKALYEQALSLGVDKEGRPIPIAGVAHTGLGQLFLEWNDLESARSHLERGIALTRGWGEAGTITGYGTLARVSQATGDCEGAHELLDKAEQIAIRFDAMDVDDIGVALRKADLSLAEGGLQEALNWSEQRGLKRDPRTVAMDLTDAGPSFTRRYVRLAEYIVFAKLLTALGRSQPKGARESFQEAEALLAALLDWAESEGRAAMQVQIQVLRAMTLREMGKTDLALRHLESALTLAEPEGYVRCFVQEGQPMAELLGLAVSQGISTAYVRQLLSSPESHGTFDPNSRFAGQADPTIQEQPLIDPLSDRELEVLRLLPSSLSSTEIAEQLFISVNTVRSHIRSIYGKLDVHSRHEAIARAQELNLI